MKYYLAYGPNLNLVQMRQRCPNARVVGVYIFIRCAPGLPWFQERLLFDHGFSAAWCPSMVGCGVYEISDKDEQALDVYAGVPYFYQKQTMQVQWCLGRHYATGSSA